MLKGLCYLAAHMRWYLSFERSLRRTFPTLDDKTQILQKLEEIALELEIDMAESGWTGRTVTLKFKLDNYKGRICTIIHIRRF